MSLYTDQIARDRSLNPAEFDAAKNGALVMLQSERANQQETIALMADWTRIWIKYSHQLNDAERKFRAHFRGQLLGAEEYARSRNWNVDRMITIAYNKARKA